MLKALAALMLLLVVSLPGAAQAGGVFIAFPFPFIFPFPFFGAPYYSPPAYYPPPAPYYPQPAVYQPQAAPAATTAHPAAASAAHTATSHNCKTFKGNATSDDTHEPFYGTACLGTDGKWHIHQP